MPECRWEPSSPAAAGGRAPARSRGRRPDGNNGLWRCGSCWVTLGSRQDMRASGTPTSQAAGASSRRYLRGPSRDVHRLVPPVRPPQARRRGAGSRCEAAPGRSGVALPGARSAGPGCPHKPRGGLPWQGDRLDHIDPCRGPQWLLRAVCVKRNGLGKRPARRAAGRRLALHLFLTVNRFPSQGRSTARRSRSICSRSSVLSCASRRRVTPTSARSAGLGRRSKVRR